MKFPFKINARFVSGSALVVFMSYVLGGTAHLIPALARKPSVPEGIWYGFAVVFGVLALGAYLLLSSQKKKPSRA